MDYSLKLVALDQLVNRNVNMHELNKDRETPLMTAINLKNRLNCNALLAVEHNDNQRYA